MKFFILFLFCFLSLSKCDWHFSTFDADQSLSANGVHSTNRQVRSLSENQDQNESSRISETKVTRISGSQRRLKTVLHQLKRDIYIQKRKNKEFKKNVEYRLLKMNEYTENLEDRFNELKTNYDHLKNLMDKFMGGFTCFTVTN